MSEYISVLRRQPEDIRAGAAPFAVYVDGELWCECEDYFSVAEKLAALLPDFRLREEHSLTEGMAEFVPVYKLLGKIPAIRNISNKIIVLERK